MSVERIIKYAPRILAAAACALAACAFISCARTGEMTLAEIDELLSSGQNALLSKTVSKPWRGEARVPGVRGGDWLTSMNADPKSFNLLVAERDGSTMAIVKNMHDYLLDYDYVRREFVPNCASAEVLVDEARETLSVVYTLRDDLWWSFYGSDRRVKVTSDDVIFWYDEIEGDPEFRSSAYNSQFVTMKDGTEKRVTIRKIDELRFAFDFPRIDSNPLLSTNRYFGPRFLYEKAKRSGGVQGVLNLFSVATDPREIPSMGIWFIGEYTPGQRLVFERNPDYWRRDANGVSVPYPDRKIMQIVADDNTKFLLFKQGKAESYTLRPEDLEDLVSRENPDYTVFNAEGSLSAYLWSFNQNPKGAETPQYEWFTKKEFRQAMSCLLNRDRIISQSYRGLAEPKLTFFAEPNPFYDPDIRIQYLFDPARAVALLASIGMARDSAGVMRDVKGRPVEFDLTIPAETAIANDIASIIADECERVGITVRIRSIDFQKVIEQLTATYDWQTLIIGLGSNYWPTQGPNVWLSSGNLHMWYPLQEKPATEWEARIDYLYNEGSCTLDRSRAKEIWDEYQAIFLEECPVIYLVRPRSFMALRNRWDFTNMYYDNIGGFLEDDIWLRPQGGGL